MPPYLKHVSRKKNSNSLDHFVTKVAKDLILKIDQAEPASDSYRRLLANAITMAAQSRQAAEKNAREIENLRHIATTDSVTKCLNRRGFSYALRQALERARRFGETGFLIMIDLDGFKQINDSFGHCCGDNVLRSLGICLRQNTRFLDHVARIGGDEFAVILSNVSPEKGRRKASELERIVNAITVTENGNNINIRASFGYEAYGMQSEETSLLARADNNMYARKRNRQKTDILDTPLTPQPVKIISCKSDLLFTHD